MDGWIEQDRTDIHCICVCRIWFGLVLVRFWSEMIWVCWPLLCASSSCLGAKTDRIVIGNLQWDGDGRVEIGKGKGEMGNGIYSLLYI